MELLERLFSLWETENRVGARRRARPLASVSLGGDPVHSRSPKSTQTCTRGGCCPRGSTRPSSHTAAGSLLRSQDTPLHIPPHLPRGGFLSHCQRRKSRINLGIPIPCLPPEQLGQPQCSYKGWGTFPLPQHPQGTLVMSLDVLPWQSPRVEVCSGSSCGSVPCRDPHQAGTGTLRGSGHHLPTGLSLI